MSPTIRKRVAMLAASACIAVAALAAASSAQVILPGPPSPLAPAVAEMEADWAKKGRVRLRAEVVPRGMKVARVTFRYRRKAFKAKHIGRFDYVRTVKARGGDRGGDRIRFRVRACTATRCASRTGRDEAD